MIWPVFGHRVGRVERVASFFTSSDAVDFAMHPERDGFAKRNLYIGEPAYDRREAGYRPAEKPSGYQAWLAEVDAKKLQVAA